jgi:hypothetical protein
MYELMQRVMPLPIDRSHERVLWQYMLRHNIKHIYVDVDKTLLHKRVIPRAAARMPMPGYVGLNNGIHNKYRFLGETVDPGNVENIDRHIGDYSEYLAMDTPVYGNCSEYLAMDIPVYGDYSEYYPMAPPVNNCYSEHYAVKINTVLIAQLRYVLTAARQYYFGGVTCINAVEFAKLMPTINILSTGGWQELAFKNYFARNYLLKFSSFRNYDDVMADIESPKIGYMAKGRVKLDWSVGNLLIDGQQHQQRSFSMRYNGYSLAPGTWWNKASPRWLTPWQEELRKTVS